MLAKFKINSKEVFISKTLIDTNISLDELVLIDNMLKEHEELKKEIKNLNT